MAAGAWGPLRSTIPAATFPAWTSLVSGVNPGRHGVLDFTERVPGTYRVRFVNGSYRRVPGRGAHRAGHLSPRADLWRHGERLRQPAGDRDRRLLRPPARALPRHPARRRPRAVRRLPGGDDRARLARSGARAAAGRCRAPHEARRVAARARAL